MTATFFPIWFIDVVGSVLMIVFTFISLGYCLQLKKKDPTNIIINYLLWVCMALSVFAISRSAGHLLKQIFLLSDRRDLWTAIQPFSGAINTFTFIVVASVTLFFERTWAIYGTILKDRQALQTAHEELIYLNQNLEGLVEQRTEALAISEQKYRRIFEVSKDMILVTRMDGRIVNINPAGQQLVGWPTTNDGAVEGQFFQDYLSGPDDWTVIKQHIADRGFISSEEFDLGLEDGTQRRVLLSGSLAKSHIEEGETIHFLIKDIEQRRLMQKQMAQADKLASIGELSSGIAHEINNPLGIILGYTQLMIRGESDRTERFQDLKTIEKHVRHCQSIVGDLLKFARSSPPKRELVDIHTLIDEVLQLVQYQGDLAQITIRRAYDDRISELHLDAKKIKQVFINLIMNASYAMGRQGTLTLSTGLNPSGDSVILDIKDTGCGIQSKDLPRIFDPFYTTKPTDQGTGLGLSVSYGIIKNHGGDISVSSWAGEGTTFSILLPLPLGHGEASARTVSGHPDFKDDHIVDAEAAGEKDTGS
jgi:two-component system, NtrC family, sensor kinase